MKAIILARVSSKEQEDNNSIPAQLRHIKEYADRNNLDIIETHELVESSTKNKRPEFNKIVTRIEKSKETVALIVDTIDRLQRGFRESVQLDELRKAGKLELHFIRENLVINDTSNSSTIISWDIGVVLAKSYVTQATDNIKRGQAEKIKNGEWLSKAPFGYKNIRKENDKPWVIPDENSHIVFAIFKRYSTGAHSMQDLCKWLFDTYGINKQKSQIQHILANPFYSGKMRIKGQLYQHAYDTIITPELFDSTQQAASRYNKPAFKFAGLPFLYRGMIACSHCGCRVTPERKKGHAYYHCTQHKGKHGAKWLREEEISRQLNEAICAVQPSAEQYAEAVETLKKANDDQKNIVKNIRSNVGLELSRIESRTKRLFDIYIDGDISKKEYGEKRSEYNLQKEKLERKLLSLDESSKCWYDNAILIMDLVRNASLLFEQCSEMEQKRHFLNLLFQNLELHESQLRWKYKKPFDSMASFENCPMWCWK